MEVELTKPDVYGQRHPIETPELIDSRLKELDEALDVLNKKDNWLQAKEKCPPELIGNQFKLMFLRCHKFKVQAAAERMETYWEHRIRIFGPEKAFLPLTQEGALRDDGVALRMGVAQLVVGSTDPDGRPIFFFTPGNQDKTKYTRESMARVFWYIIHASLEDYESAQQKGVIFISYAKGVKFSQFDRGLVGVIAPSINGALPIRLAAMHVCYPPSFFSVIFSVIKIFLGEKLRKRVRNQGSKNVPAKLAEFGLTEDILPEQLSGKIKMDLEKWIEERKAAGK